MTDWLHALDELRKRGKRGVLITVAEAQGSVPRDPGTKMVASEDAAFGTIGGGRLEYEALKLAREMLAQGAPTPLLRRFGLGPSLGQCCGGSARLLFEPVAERPEPWEAALRDMAARGQPTVLVTALCANGSEKIIVGAEEVIGALHDRRRHDDVVQRARALLSGAGAGVRFEQGETGAVLLFEPIRQRGLHLVLFGAGHVGRALVRVLGETPCRITWIDGRPEQFPREVPPNVSVECTEMPQYAVERAPAGSAFLVMTHSHDLDLLLCERILRRGDFVYCGLIGSATKRAKFVRRLRARGLAAETIARMVCPIGIPGLAGKHPGEIAIAVAAQLLMVQAPGAEQSPAPQGEAAS